MPFSFDSFDDDDGQPQAPKKHVLIIDDTLDMEIKKHRLLRQHDGLHDITRITDNPSVNVDVSHAEGKEDALQQLKKLAGNGVKPEDVVVISDYKLQVPGKE